MPRGRSTMLVVLVLDRDAAAVVVDELEVVLDLLVDRARRSRVRSGWSAA